MSWFENFKKDVTNFIANSTEEELIKSFKNADSDFYNQIQPDVSTIDDSVYSVWSSEQQLNFLTICSEFSHAEYSLLEDPDNTIKFKMAS